MHKIKGFALASSLLFGSSLSAAPPPVKAPVAEQTYKCRAFISHPGIPKGMAEHLFQVPVKGTSSHGGEPIEFMDGNQKLTVLADGKWLGISWWIGEKRIAETVTVIGNATTEPRVLIAYDPENPGENQASLDCNL